MDDEYLPDVTVESAMVAQREAIAALRRKVEETGSIQAAKELSLASRRFAEQIKIYKLEVRLKELEALIE